MQTEHTFKQYDNELEAIRAKVLQMGGLVEEQIIHAIDSLTNANMQLADKVIARDHDVNALEVSVDGD